MKGIREIEKKNRKKHIIQKNPYLTATDFNNKSVIKVLESPNPRATSSHLDQSKDNMKDEEKRSCREFGAVKSYKRCGD